MTRLAFIDTETTSLRHDRRIWEIGMIVRDDESEQDYTYWDKMYIDIQDLDLGNADPFSLRVGRFHERHPQMKYDNPVRAAYGGDAGSWRSELSVLTEVEWLTRDATLVGAVVNFDAEVLASRMRANGIAPSWHYHLIDIEPMVYGYLAGLRNCSDFRTTEDDLTLPSLPWKSTDLSEAIGVDQPPESERHTALGDAMWVMRMYDKVMGLD